MRLVETKCPNCGSSIKVEDKKIVIDTSDNKVINKKHIPLVILN